MPPTRWIFAQFRTRNAIRRDGDHQRHRREHRIRRVEADVLPRTIIREHEILELEAFHKPAFPVRYRHGDQNQMDVGFDGRWIRG